MKKMNINMLGILMALILVLSVPAGASKVVDIIGSSKMAGTSNPVAKNMNLTLHANTNTTDKLNTKNGNRYTVISTTKNGKLTVNADGTFKYVPNKNFLGKDSFKYVVGNGKTNSSTATVTIDVKNDPPTASSSSINTYKNTVNCGVLTASDPDNDKLNYKIVSNPNFGVVTLDQNGKYCYTPKRGFIGVDSFSFKVNDGIADSNVTNITIKVENEAPTAENATFNAHLRNPSMAYTGFLNATDPDNDGLNYEILSKPNFGTLTLEENGRYTYTPNSNFIGIDSFTYVANDGTENSNVANVTINLENQVPVAEDIKIKQFNDYNRSVYIGALTVNDGDDDSLSYKLISQPKYGSVYLNGETGVFVYLPNPKFQGIDDFSYVANDGITDSNIATVSVLTENQNQKSRQIIPSFN